MNSLVYVGHLSRGASKKDVEDLLSPYGRVDRVTIKDGYGFVQFDNVRDAKEAVYELNGTSFMSERLVVEHARYSERKQENGRGDRYAPIKRTGHRLIVENLAHGVSWQDVKDLMRHAGKVLFADLSKDFDDQAVVEFASEDDMRYALKSLDGEELRGKPITLRLFDSAVDSVPRDLGRGEGGGVRDRDRDRDHGRDRAFKRDRGQDRDRDGRDRGSERDRGHDRDREERDRELDRGRRDRRDREDRRDRHRSRSRSRSPRTRHVRGRDRSRDRRRSPSPKGRGYDRRVRSRSRGRDRDTERRRD
ncbi:serine arginine-rich splicing factor [Mortierella alpina]|nr:serine arginine-rich splicing factor [Mortierella alpina]